MHYLNVTVATVRSPEAASVDDADLGAWLRLAVFCAEAENGGRIINCSGWTPRQWQRLVGVDDDVVDRGCPLWSWDGSDLVVSFYPLEQEERFKMKRELGKKGGRTPKRPRQPDPNEDPDPDQDRDSDKDIRASAPAKARAKAPAKARASKPAKSNTKFIPPTVDEVRAYCAEMGYTFDPEVFVAYYGSQDWKKANGCPVTNWHACCVTFQKRETPRSNGKRSGSTYTGMTTSDSGEWIYDIYRRTDMDAHGNHERWKEYIEAAADYAPRQAPPFETWLETSEPAEVPS